MVSEMYLTMSPLIAGGRTGKGLLGAAFFLIDQIDSLVSVMLALYLVTDISIGKYEVMCCWER